MRIGIFGGSFNPPHKMHENIVNYLVNNSYLDKVILVPTGSKYKYKSNLGSEIDRYNMVKLITDKYSYMDVSNFEMKDEVVYTVDTLEHFKLEYLNDEIYFICGTDNLTYMDKWMKGEYILENYKILVINRNTNKIDEILNRFNKYKDNIIVVDMEEFDISSTAIRNNLLENIDMIDDEVLDYIKKNKLYEGE